nr:C39 family peptidase [Salirhabdus sp. Marseille-P4669]
MNKVALPTTLLSISLLVGCGTMESKESMNEKKDNVHNMKEEKVIATPLTEPPSEDKIVVEMAEEEELTMLKYNPSGSTGQSKEKMELLNFTPEPFKEAVQIAAKEANIRKGPHTSYEAIKTVKKNTTLEVFEKATVDGTTWYHVSIENEKGWISANIVEAYEQTDSVQVKNQTEVKNDPAFKTESFNKDLEISAQVGNVRKGPGTNYSVLTTLNAYTKVVATEKAVVDGATWYHVTFSDQSGWVSSAIVDNYNPNLQMVLIDAPHSQQMPELPRGCEVTSLSMLLGHADVHVDKMTLANEIRRDPTPYQKKNGQVFFGNPYDGFVGDMYSFETPGLGVYHGPIAELGEKYLPGRIVDLTGNNFDAVLDQLDQGKPVWVIVTSTFASLPQSYWRTWNTPSGEIQITYKEHSVLVTGYDENYIYFNDPLAAGKNSRASKESFIAGWEQIGKQAITYK